MGWAAVLALPTLWVALPGAAALLLLLAGLFYTAGALVFRWQRPDPFPHIFGYHELFHLLVIGGSAAIAVVLWVWVVPLL
jgi:hemolysin III